MNRATGLISIIFLFFVLSGCSTMSGAATGFKNDFQNTWKNFAGAGGAIERADTWIKENWW